MKKPLLLLICATALSAAATAANYNGYLDSADCALIKGWAWDSTLPNTPIGVDLYDGSTQIERVAAGDYRADLPPAGIGNGYHAFNYVTPASLKDGQNHTIYAYIGGTNFQLNTSPRTLNCPAGSTGYQYYYSDALTSINTSNWTSNGFGSATSGGFTSTAGGTLVSKIAPPTGVSYEVKMTLTLAQSGGHYLTLLRATNDANPYVTSAGTYYSIEVANPTFSNGACSATLNFSKNTLGMGTTTLVTMGIPCHNGLVVRSVMRPDGVVAVFLDNVFYFNSSDSEITAGAPGIAVYAAPSGNAISQVQLGPLDSIAPNAPGPVRTSSFPTHVDFQWPGTPDDPNGTGVFTSWLYRNGTFLGWITNNTVPYSDPNTSPGTTYTYQLIAVDYHLNTSSTTMTVTTPPAGTTDPREIGVRPAGSYWGASGENVDLRSGNLNFTIPLLKVKGRGWSVPFHLSYNSQNWRRDSTVDWDLGNDGGFGWGWKLQGGALVPVHAGYFVLDHYLFIDASGAEYRFTQNNGGIWTSPESGMYLEYDSNAGRLYFPDGTFWVFGCTSAGTEQDSGVQYPTLIQDSNGNQINITYQAGQGVTWTNSSSRMTVIQDVMGTYNFFYTGGAFPHLTVITSSYPDENYTLQYSANANLQSPFSSTQFGLAQMLQSVTNTNTQMTTSFSYIGNGAGELSQVTFPYGGYLRWTYSSTTYSGNRTQDEVQTRYLALATPPGELAYSFQKLLDTSFHNWTVLDDADGVSEKAWWFETDSTKASFGLQKTFEHRPHHYPNVNGGTHEDDTWSTDTLGRPYISSMIATMDMNNPTAVQKRTDQSLDQYGNVLTMSQWDFGAASATRVYTNTYLSDSSPTSVHPSGSNYNAEHIHNRVLTSTVTQGSQTTTLFSNIYDRYSDVGCPANQWSFNTNTHYWQFYPGIGAIDSTSSTNQYRGNVTTNNGLAISRSMCYDVTGNVLAVNAAGHWTTTQSSSQTNYSSPGAITTGSLTTTLNWTSFLAPSSQTGPNGDIAGIGYDSAGRPASTTTPYGASTTYTYSTSPAQTTAVVNSNDPNTNGRKTITKLDGLGRTIEVDSIDAGGTERSVVQMVYAPCGCSPLGKLSQQSRPFRRGDSIYWTTYTYDGLGRTVAIAAPDGSTTTYTYAGNTVTVTDPTGPSTDPAGHSKTFTMDAFGNLTKVVEPDSSQTNSGRQATTTYLYDALNHLTQVSMPRQMPGNTVTQIRSFNYGTPPGAYLLSASNPENGIVSYSYNADGTLAWKLDAKGQKLKYAYDSYARVTTVSLAGNPDTTLRTYTYDTNPSDSTYSQYSWGRLTTVQYSVPSTSTATDRFGHPITFTGDTVTEMYSYTQPGQVAGKRLRVARQPSSGQALTADLNATWDYTSKNEGHLMGVTYPGDPNSSPYSYSYTYDGMGRLNTMTEANSGPGVNAAQYNAAGQMTVMGQESRSYNSMGQLTGIAYGTSLTISYTYSAPGLNNGKIATETYNGEQVTYAYDSLNRLISAQASGWNQGFVYDPFGNLTDKTGSYSWHGVPDAYTNHLGSVDANGNALYSPSGTYLIYDAENRLTNGGTAQYAYDGQNKRIWAVTWDSTHSFYMAETYYFYSPQGKLMAQFTPTYLQQTGTLGFLNGTQRAYFGSRLLGSEDQVGSRGKYFPYGEDNSSQNPASDNVKFATYTRDSATGLDYANQRYYASGTGRFMTPDPYMASGGPGSPQSWNRYSYTRGDPINRFDPAGRADFSVDAYGIMDTDEDEGQQSGEGGGQAVGSSGAKAKIALGQVGDGNRPSIGKTPQPLSAARDLALKALSTTDCLGLFETPKSIAAGLDPTTVFNAVYGNPGNLFPPATMVNGTPVSSSFVPSQFLLGKDALTYWGFVVGMVGWRPYIGTGINVAINADEFSAGSPQIDATVLLHELGHVLNMLFPGASKVADDGTSSAASQANTDLIFDKCGFLVK